MRVAGDMARVSVKVFALTRDTGQGDTPVSRWQFQTSYPYYSPGITRYGSNSASRVFAAAGGGGPARVYRPSAVAPRDYPLYGGRTPGPAFLVALPPGRGASFALPPGVLPSAE